MSFGFGGAAGGGFSASGADSAPIFCGGTDGRLDPTTVSGAGADLSVTYFSARGSKNENWKTGIAVFFVSGTTAISKVFVPGEAGSSGSAGRKELDGGYVRHPFSSTKTGAVMRSKLPRPPTRNFIVNGSPILTSLGEPSAENSKFPTAPEKSRGCPAAGSGFTFKTRAGAFCFIPCEAENIGSPKMSSSNMSNAERGPPGARAGYGRYREFRWGQW